MTPCWWPGSRPSASRRRRACRPGSVALPSTAPKRPGSGWPASVPHPARCPPPGTRRPTPRSCCSPRSRSQAASYEAIASRLGCPVGTVQARLVRARRRLRVALIREGRYPAPCDAAHRQLVTMRTPAPRPAGNSEGVYSIEASDDHGGRTGPVREGPGPAVRSRVVNGG
jgi:Sigma-70, region 4